MKIDIITAYPLWFVIFCLLLGAGYSWLLYWQDHKNGFSPRLKKVLAAFRFLCVSIVAFLLLSPLIKTLVRTVEKPVIIIATDNSESLSFCKDSSYYRNKYPEEFTQLIDGLKKDYEVRCYDFGQKTSDNITYNFKDKQTDISSFFDDMEDIYANRNVGAMIIATDGLYNKGQNPLYSSDKLKFPIYTIALGDTNVQKDIIISRVNYNRTVFLGNTFPVQIIVDAFKCNGERSKLTVSKEKQEVLSKELNFPSNTFSQTINLQLEANKTGLQHYHISIVPLKNEISTTNNQADIFVEVIDERQKILILANSPHPDVSAIKQSLEKNNNYTVDAFDINDFNKSLSIYNLVIMHQLPSQDNTAAVNTRDILASGIPSLFIIGPQSNLSAFNTLRLGMVVNGNKASANEAVPVINNEFALFTVSDGLRKAVDDFPPLNCPFGNYKTTTSANILFYQKIGTVTSSQPLILFNQVGEQRTGIISGEGIWKWKLFDFLQHNNHELFDELIGKIIQYLSVKIDKSLFRVIHKNHFYENENIEFDAEVYNDSYQLINGPDVNMTITNSENKSFPFVFSKTNNAYHLNAGNLAVGDYKFNSTVKVGEKVNQKSGVFSVMPLNVESVNTLADHSLLYSIAKRHGGEMVFPSQMQQLIEKIKNRDDIKPISFMQKRFNDMINLIWVFFIIMILITAEWFLRKRAGAY